MNWFKSLFKKPVAPSYERAISRLSLRDDVIGIRENLSGEITVFVRGNVADSFDSIVRQLRQDAPGVHGDVRSGTQMPLAMLGSYPAVADVSNN